MNDVTAIIPTLPERRSLLSRALASVEVQTHRSLWLQIEEDAERTGVAATRNRALSRAVTTWVATLDDDDEWLPHHLEHLLSMGNATGADVVWSRPEAWRDGEPISDPLVHSAVFDPARLARESYIPSTALIRRSALVDVGGWPTDETPEDWALWRRLSAVGAVFAHTPAITWRWHFHDANTWSQA